MQAAISEIATATHVLFVPDAILPEQFTEQRRKSVDCPGEIRLAYAILKDAFLCLKGHAVVTCGSAAQRIVRQRLAKQHAWTWIFDDFDENPFSFVNICVYLDIDPSAVRDVVQARIERP